MEISRACKRCRKPTLEPDLETGNTICSTCGTVQDFDNFQSQFGGVTGPTGTFIHVGTSGSGSSLSYTDKKIYEAEKLISDLVSRLNLSVSKSRDLKNLIEKITNHTYGAGAWFPVFVGACAYVIMRKDQKTLPLVEICDSIDCEVHELGRMINRVVDYVDLKLPLFDIVDSFERAFKTCSCFRDVEESDCSKMLGQGLFLVQCLIKWFVTTGRTPIPVVVAVLVFVGELNGVSVRIGDVASEMHVGVLTCKRRYNEILDKLVEVGKECLPWGKDVCRKNIVKNAPFVIQYMEMKSSGGKKRKGFEESLEFDMEGFVGDCLSKEVGYGFDGFSIEEDSSSSLKYFDLDRSSNNVGSDDDCFPDKFRISPETLSMMYSNFVDGVSLAKANAEIGGGVDNNAKTNRMKSLDVEMCTEWWKGKSDLSKKLLLKQILEKDVGFDPMPPSFDKGCLVEGNRRERIKSAKMRINRIMHPEIGDSGYSKDICLVEPESLQKKKRKRKTKVDIDWEDLMIETLLLHNVKEEEIEKGHYNVLLALHVFDNGVE